MTEYPTEPVTKSATLRVCRAAICLPLLHALYSSVSSCRSSARWLHSWEIKVDIKLVAFCFLIEIEIEISNSKVRIRGAVCYHQLDNDRTVSSQYEQQTPSRLRKRGPQDLATARY